MTDDSSNNKPEAAAAAPATPTESGTSFGGRVRKTTQKFTFVEAKHEEPDEFTPPAGSGVKLRDILFVGDSVRSLCGLLCGRLHGEVGALTLLAWWVRRSQRWARRTRRRSRRCTTSCTAAASSCGTYVPTDVPI